MKEMEDFMAGFLDTFRKKIKGSVYREREDAENASEVALDDKIALGVLLWVVAEADDRFLPEEKAQMKKVLQESSQISAEDLPCVLGSIEIAAQERIDLHTFTHEVSKDLSRDVKIQILDNLFRVACADQDLDQKEHEMIRKIAGLFRLDHKEFIDSKIRVKKEYGMDTAGL
jgi:uncharacterized tellurite resistance protein B-like protein